MSIVSDEITSARNNGNGQEYTIILSCLHTLTFGDPAPKMGEELWCRRCQAVKPAAIAPPNYTLTCDHGCAGKRLRHEFGTALITAETRAVEHSMKRAGHRVTLANGLNHVREFFSEILHVDVDVPPF